MACFFSQVRIFCIYTSVAVLFTYAYHITFFGATMAYFGQVERNNLHGLICVPVVPKSLAGMTHIHALGQELPVGQLMAATITRHSLCCLPLNSRLSQVVGLGRSRGKGRHRSYGTPGMIAAIDFYRTTVEAAVAACALPLCH